MRLRSLLFIVSSIITLIPVLFFGIWPHTHAFQNEIDRVSEQHVLIAQNIARVLERYDRDVKAAFGLLAKNALEETRIENVDLLLANFHFRNICIVEPHGLRVVHALNAEGYPCAERFTEEAFETFSKNAVAGGAEFTAVMAGPDGSPHLYLTARLREYLTVGALSTDYIVELGKAVAFGERGHAAIVDHTGAILAHPWRAGGRSGATSQR